MCIIVKNNGIVYTPELKIKNIEPKIRNLIYLLPIFWTFVNCYTLVKSDMRRYVYSPSVWP